MLKEKHEKWGIERKRKENEKGVFGSDINKKEVVFNGGQCVSVSVCVCVFFSLSL